VGGQYGEQFWGWLKSTEERNKMTNILLILFSVAAAVCGQLCLKHGMLKIGYIQLNFQALPGVIFNALTSPFVLLGLASYFIGALCWLVVLSRVELSWAQPLTAMTYIFIVFFSWLLFKEDVGLIRILGVLAIVVGVFLVSRS